MKNKPEFRKITKTEDGGKLIRIPKVVLMGKPEGKARPGPRLQTP
jgi:hypothetical protein